MKVTDSIRRTLFRFAAFLPLTVLYFFADITAFFLRYVIRYRRRVIFRNLRASFPELPDREIRHIAGDFYRNFADYIFETMKLAHISDKEMLRRMEFRNVEVVDRLFSEGKSIIAYFAHTGNWEWVPSITLHSRFADNPKFLFAQVYRPLKNKWFDGEMLSLRSRFGSVSYPKASVLRDLLTLRRDGICSITGFMSDQKPSHGDTVHVVDFLHQPTAVITGTAKVATRMKMAVVYFDMHKISRGHYMLDIRHITDDASEMSVAELTDIYIGMLQETIRRQPAIWLWSHNRWKIPVSFDQEELTAVKNQSAAGAADA